MKKVVILLFVVSFQWSIYFSQDKNTGVRGAPEAIAEAKDMVETMGGIGIWANEAVWKPLDS